MAMAIALLRQENPDSTLELICARCLQVVARRIRLSEVVRAEKTHVCDPWEFSTNTTSIPNEARLSLEYKKSGPVQGVVNYANFRFFNYAVGLGGRPRWHSRRRMASFFPSALGVRGTMRFPNHKEGTGVGQLYIRRQSPG